MLLSALLLLGGAACTTQVGLNATLADTDAGVVWIVRSGNSICGLDDPKMLSAPAKVRYERLYQATPEIRRMESEGIAPDSATGILLRQQAIDRIYRCCELVRVRRGHCSVWKEIRHVDGRPIPDLTEAVLALY